MSIDKCVIEDAIKCSLAVQRGNARMPKEFSVSDLATDIHHALTAEQPDDITQRLRKILEELADDKAINPFDVYVAEICSLFSAKPDEWLNIERAFRFGYNAHIYRKNEDAAWIEYKTDTEVARAVFGSAPKRESSTQATPLNREALKPYVGWEFIFDEHGVAHHVPTPATLEVMCKLYYKGKTLPTNEIEDGASDGKR